MCFFENVLAYSSKKSFVTSDLDSGKKHDIISDGCDVGATTISHDNQHNDTQHNDTQLNNE
jgi:hypothetical protein